MIECYHGTQIYIQLVLTLGRSRVRDDSVGESTNMFVRLKSRGTMSTNVTKYWMSERQTS